MSSSLLRVAEIASALKQTEHAAEVTRLYDIAYRAAHSHPRKSRTVRNIFRRLRKMAQQAGVWESLKEGVNAD